MQHILLLHGATGSKEQLLPIANLIGDDYHAHLFNFHGHGGEDPEVADFSIPLFADQVLQYLDTRKIDAVSIFGYSMGGYVAMYTARHFPERINRVITLGTKFYWDHSIAAREIRMLDAGKIMEKVPVFAKELESRHSAVYWKEVLRKTAGMLYLLGQDNLLKPADFSLIETPSLVLLGDRDKMVTLDETVAVFKSLKHGQLGVLPGTPHPLEQVNMQRLALELRQFIN